MFSSLCKMSVVDTDNVLKIIFPSDVTDEYKESEEIIKYISQIGCSNIDQVNHEPGRLEEQRNHLLEQTQELTFSNYKTFIQTAECSREICTKFTHTESSVESIISNLQDFKTKCQELSKISSEVDTNRKLNSSVSSKSNQILDILELPLLMKNCIKNGHFEEALELAAYVKRFAKKHSDISIINDIAKDFDVSWSVMLEQLLSELRTDIQLPKCLQIVGYLRRMETFNEAQLRLKFLQARDSWLQQVLSTLPKDDNDENVLKMIEMSRIHLFNMVTQYKAIFSDEEVVLASPNINHVNEITIFYSWLNEKISQFLSSIDKQELNKNNFSLDSLMAQCMFFSLSFSRVGADFRALLAPKFVKLIQQNFELRIRKASKTFEQDMDKFIIKKIKITLALKQVESAEHPPMCLMEFYPLAHYTNGVLAAFNDLRNCAPLMCAHFITTQIQDSLKNCSKVIFNCYRQEEPTFSQIEKENFSKLCGAFQILVQYLQKCIHVIYPVHDLAQHLGILIHQLQKDGLSYLDESLILNNLHHLMPVDVLIPDLNEEKLGEEVILPVS